MPAELMDWAFGLLKSNMQTLYENSGWGWSDSKKRGEMSLADMRYIVARELASGRPAGYLEFLGVVEDRGTVFYMYELQIEPDFHRKGLGKFLVQTFELFARRSRIDWIHLTVFTDNEAAVAFYKALKFVRDDEESPDLEQAAASGEPVRWMVMSKRLAHAGK